MQKQETIDVSRSPDQKTQVDDRQAPEETLSGLAERVSLLEKRNRRLACLTVVALAVAIISCTDRGGLSPGEKTAQASAQPKIGRFDIVEATRFVVRDKSGNLRGRFGMGPEDWIPDLVGLKLYPVRKPTSTDSLLEGFSEEFGRNACAELIQTKPGAMLQLLDSEGKHRAGISFSDFLGLSQVLLSGREGVGRCDLQVAYGTSLEKPSLTLSDNRERVLFSKP